MHQILRTRKVRDRWFQKLSGYWILNTEYCWMAILLLCWGITRQTMFLRCQSDSLLNISYLLVWKGSAFQRGDIVCLQNHRIRYVEGNKFLAKRVIGLPEDRIQQEENTIKVIPRERDLKPFVLPLLEQTSKGEPLTPLLLTTISDGTVFVAGDHPKSFDSRYEEFGLVRIEKIIGRAIAVFSSQYPVFRWTFSLQKSKSKGEK